MINITIWNESTHREHKGNPYPDGMNAALKSIFGNAEEYTVTCALLDDPQQGFPDGLLENTDVLLWWGHCRHEEVDDALAEAVAKRVRAGMGAVFLHSGHYSKPFRLLMGTSCSLAWREYDNEAERVWITDPYHPISRGVDNGFRIDAEEMYGEFFDIPKPDSVVFTGWFSGGEVFRSVCTFTRGQGRIAYCQPGHESFPIYYNDNVRRIIKNAAEWVACIGLDTATYTPDPDCVHRGTPLETIAPKG